MGRKELQVYFSCMIFFPQQVVNDRSSFGPLGSYYVDFIFFFYLMPCLTPKAKRGVKNQPGITVQIIIKACFKAQDRSSNFA